MSVARGVSEVSRKTNPVPISLAEALGGHQNSLGLIRLVLASLVIFHHAYPLGGFGGDPGLIHTQGQASLGSISVAGFFAISGYLIMKSGMSADVVQYFWRRALRIFPAYWVILLFTAFIVAPIIWVIGGREFSDFFSLAPNGPFNYVQANWQLGIGTYGIYDIFQTSTPYGQEVGYSVFNGSIWTLMYEWHCYVLVGAGVAFGVMYRAKIIVPIFTAFLLLIQIVNLSNPGGLSAIAPYLADVHTIGLTFTFMLGATLAIYSHKIAYGNGLGIFSGVVLLLTLRYGGFLTLGTIAGAYFVMYLAARLPRQLHWIGAKNDYSYGVYIYGFLVQQVMAHLGWHKLGYLPYALLALVVTFGLAWLSWHGIEKRAMALKDWGPGRGVQFWLSWVARARSRPRSRGSVSTATGTVLAPPPVAEG